MSRTIRLGSLLAASALMVAACSPPEDSTSPETDIKSGDIVLTSGLETVDSCDDLLDRIKEEAVERVGPYGFGSDNQVFLAEGALAVESPTADSAFDDSATDASAGEALSSGIAEKTEYSETNNQEQGVDEADLVKTDGDRMVVVSQDKVRILDVSGATPELVDTIKLPDNVGSGEMFFEGDRAILMTSGWTEQPFSRAGGDAIGWYPGSPTGRLIELNLENGTVERTLEFEGSYLSAREIDGAVRIVLSAATNRFNFVYPSNDGAEESAENANRQLIEDSTIDQWVPTYRIIEGSGFDGNTKSSEAGPLVDCNRMYLPSEFAGFGSLVVLTTELDKGLALNDSVGIFTDAQTIYASTDRLVVATPRWPEFDPETGAPIDDGEYTTALHTFDIENPRKAEYVASGSVLGSLLSQYSLSEHEGYLRAATTVGGWNGDSSESMVTVLEENGSSLERVGRVDGLGRGEQIFAVRFFGDKGYVVTFRQIDPLYVIDLSDPKNPTTEGELKIPGFSSYLHPIGEDLLLGVGTDGDDEGNTFGTVVSLFDVSNPADPTRIDKLTLEPDNGAEQSDYFESHSNVGSDPRSFTYWEPTDTAIIPFSWFAFDEELASESNGSAAVVVEVDENGGLNEIGRVEHPGISECDTGEPYDDGIVPPNPSPEPEETENGFFEGQSEDAEPSDVDNIGEGDAEAEFVDPPRSAPEPAPVPDGESITVAPPNYCYQYQPSISRSVIIGDNLFTVSESGVDVATLDGLRQVTWIPFN